jgi:hypothetical protein
MITDEHNPSAAAGHEVADPPIRPIVLAGFATALVVAVVFGLSIGVFRFFSERPVEAPPNPMAAEAPQFPPPPRIQVAPSIEYQQLRAQEDQILSTYGWVDRKAGTVRIPIDRAIDLQLQRGFPVRKEAPKK